MDSDDDDEEGLWDRGVVRLVVVEMDLWGGWMDGLMEGRRVWFVNRRFFFTARMWMCYEIEIYG